MKNTNLALLTFVILACACAMPAQAHRFWLLPSTFTLSGEEQWISVDGAISNDLFYANHVAMPTDRIGVTAPDGSQVAIANAASGEIRSVFDVHLQQQGTFEIAEQGETYFARWTEAGENQRRRGSLDELLEAGLAEKDDVEFAVSNRKVVTWVTLGAPTRSVFELDNAGLELVPVVHPNDLFAGDAARFRVTLDGQPAEGLEVTVVKGADRYRNEAGDHVYESDGDGEISVNLAEPGAYWLSVEIEGSTEVRGIEMNQYYTIVATFEVLPE